MSRSSPNLVFRGRGGGGHGKAAVNTVFANAAERLQCWARVGIEPTHKVLQTSPLPLGYRALNMKSYARREPCGTSAERTGRGGAGRRDLYNLALARRCSTTELLPHGVLFEYNGRLNEGQRTLSG